MSNVIDIRSRLKSNTSKTKIKAQSNNILDITEKRAEALKQDRRKVRRTLLTEFIAVHTVVPNYGLMKVTLDNINENGLAFDIEEGRGLFQAGEEIAMRVYLNHQTYFPFVVRVKHVTLYKEEGVHRHGSEFVKGTINDVALHHFVMFLETISANLKGDGGDITVTNINS